MRKKSLLKVMCLFVICFGFSLQPLFCMEYISNGIVKIGINTNWGGGIGYFSRLDDVKNVINYHDTGRNIQQSFYGSWDDEYGWYFNPVQGGDKYGNGSRITSKINYGDAIYVRTIPLDWIKNNVETPCVMEQWITLREDVAQIVYRLKYNGSVWHDWWTQEMPDPYFVYDLSTLAYYSNGAIRYLYQSQISINCGAGYNGYLYNDEYWAAYVNTTTGKWGCGMYTPDTNYITYHRCDEGADGPTGKKTSHFAALGEVYTLVPGFDVQYTAYLHIANVADISALGQDKSEKKSY